VLKKSLSRAAAYLRLQVKSYIIPVGISSKNTLSPSTSHADSKSRLHDFQYAPGSSDPLADDSDLSPVKIRLKSVPSIEQEKHKCSCCGKYFRHLKGLSSGADYFNQEFCHRWFCPSCGKVARLIANTGRIHKRRYLKLLSKLGHLQGLSHISLRQFVFTLPLNLRAHFLDRAALLAFKGICLRLLKKTFPGREIISYLHCFGDGESGFHPHWNFHLIEKRGVRLLIDLDVLESIRAKYLLAMQKYCVALNLIKPGVIDLHYNFARSTNQVIHQLKYMCKPHPYYEDLEMVCRDFELYEFFVLTMKGFGYVESYNIKGVEVLSDEPSIADVELIVKERLGPGKYGCVSHNWLKMQFQPVEIEHLNDSLIRIKPFDYLGESKKDSLSHVQNDDCCPF
jgi:hypothetical protein